MNSKCAIIPSFHAKLDIENAPSQVVGDDTKLHALYLTDFTMEADR